MGLAAARAGAAGAVAAGEPAGPAAGPWPAAVTVVACW